MKVFVFYRTDQWNSTKSRDLVYIGTNKKASVKNLMKLDSEPITEEQADCLELWNSSVCCNVGYEWVVETHVVNQLPG